MLALFRKNDISALIGLCVLTVVCKWHVLMHPPSLAELEQFHRATVFSWQGLRSFYESSPFLYGLFSMILIVFMSLYINYTAVSEKLFLKKSYYPAMSFILFTSLLPSHSLVTMPLLASFLGWVALGKSLGLAQHPQAKRTIFHIGILAALAMLLYFPFIIFFILYILFVLFFRPFSLQEITAYVLGYLTPCYITGLLFYIFGTWQGMQKTLYTHLHLPLRVIQPKQTIIVGILSICVLVYGWYQYQQVQNRIHISIRKKWNAIGMYFLAAALVGIWSGYFPGSPWVFLAAPFSILLSQAVQGRKENLNIFTFYFILLTLLLMQWVIK